MAERDLTLWPPGAASTGGADSIADELASRIDAVPPSPEDAMSWAALAARYEREASALVGRPGAAQLLFESGRIHEERLGDPATALALYRRSMFADSGFVPNLQAARRLAMDRGDDAIAAEVLAAEAAATPEPEGRAELLRLRGRLLAGLGQAEDAAAVLAEADALAPDSFAATEESARAAAQGGDRSALAEAYLRCAQAVGDDRLAAHYLAAAAAVCGEGLGEMDRAAELALQAFARCPTDALIRSAARLHAERIGRLDALAGILRTDAAAASGPEAARDLLDLSRVEERRGDGAAAGDALERAWTEAPDDPRVLSALADLRESRQEWPAASEALAALAEAHQARPEDGHRLEAVAAHLRRLELEEVHLGRPEEARRACQAVLVLEPGQRTALAALGRLCARAGDWEGVLAAFRAEAEAARDPLERAQRTFKAAQVLEERLGRAAGAVEAYQAALAADPDLLAARSALERLLEREGRWAELCAFLEEDLAGAAAGDQVAVLLRVARLREERLGDLGAAEAGYRRVLALDPGNGAAFRALAAALERRGAAAELADVLAQQAAATGDRRRRLALLQRRAEAVEEAGGAPEDAAAAWEEVRVVEPFHLPALRALGRLHAAAGRWDRLADMFRAQADAASDPAQAAELLLRTGELLERRLSRTDEAVKAYHEVLTLEPSHLPALLALSRLHRARGEPEELAHVLHAQALARIAPEERAAALAELGQLCEERLSDPGRAAESHEEALAIAPGFAPSRRALERLYVQLGRRDALRALRRAALDDAQAEDRAGRLHRLAWLEADGLGDAAAAQEAAARLAELEPGSPAPPLVELRTAAEPARRARAREQLAATAAAPGPGAALLVAAALEAPSPAPERREMLARAAALEPQSPALLPEFERRARAGGAHAELAQECERRSGAEADPAARAAWAVQAGEAWEQAGEPDRALAAYGLALEAAPSHLAALRAARALQAARGDWAAVRATFQAEGRGLEDPVEAATAYREAGAVAEAHLDDPTAAAEDYRHALERDPAEPVALARLEALLGDSGGAELAEVHAARAGAETDPGRAAEAWLAAARARLDAGAAEQAVADLDRALELVPDLSAALELRARIRGEAGQPGDALADLERCLAMGGDATTRVPLHLAAAQLLQDRMGDAEGAVRHLEAALALAPESPEGLTRLAGLRREAGDQAGAAAALRTLTALPGLTRDEAVQHGLALADVEAALGDDRAALAACRKALERDASHAPALALLADLERRSGTAAGLAAALESLASASRDAGVRASAHLEAARLHGGPLRSRPAAIDHLLLCLELDPQRDEARAYLAELQEETAPGKALEQHRILLARDPLRVDSWTALFRILERTRVHDGAFVAASVLRWLGIPPPGPGAESLLLEGDRQALASPPPIGAADWELLRAAGDRGPLAELVAASGDVLASVLVDPRETRGAPVRGDHPFRKVLAELARCLGAPEHELYAAPLGRLTVEPGDPAAVRVGADLAHRSTLREQRFLLGRAAARLRTRSALAEAFPEGWSAALAAAVQQVAPGYGGLGRPDEELVRRVAKALPRKVRKAIEEPARALAARTAPDLAGWRASAAATADRAGLVLCGDVGTALDSDPARGRHPRPPHRRAAHRGAQPARGAGAAGLRRHRGPPGAAPAGAGGHRLTCDATAPPPAARSRPAAPPAGPPALPAPQPGRAPRRSPSRGGRPRGRSAGSCRSPPPGGRPPPRPARARWPPRRPRGRRWPGGRARPAAARPPGRAGSGRSAAARAA
ncbi:MAG: hypothetical protein QM767_16465 [Anaeromyxobacter sp.]